MSFGIAAGTWVAIGAAVAGTATSASNAHQQRKSTDSANDRVREAAAEDKRLAVKAEADSALAAGAQQADRKRRRSASALGSGGFGQAATPASVTPGTVSALGAGAAPVGVA